MKTLNDIITKLKFDKNSNPLEAHNEILNMFQINGWIEFKNNESIFNEYAKRNCSCKFDDGTVCDYEDKHPNAILTHFKMIN